jgi:lipid-A-disaccharide synthase
VAPEDGVKTVLIVAGEASGDQAAAPVVAALRRLRPNWRLLATGGEKMEAAGAEILIHYRELAVMGFSEVIRRLPAIRRRFNNLAGRLSRGEVDLFLPVDFPGFNLRLARRSTKSGVPVLYFIAPQVWAWGEGRVAKLRRDLDRLALILPFEEAWFSARDLQGTFVGHPIMESARPLAPVPPSPRLGLLPGSRAQEVKRLLGPMIDAAELLAKERPELQVEVLESPGLPAEFYREWLADRSAFITGWRGPTDEFLARQGAALVASGTATLETAVAGLPMAVVYRTGALNYWLARRLVSLERIALANLVAGREVVPEFIQGDSQPAALAAALGPLLDGGEERRQQLAGLTEIRELLGGPGCGEGVATMAIELLEGRE